MDLQGAVTIYRDDIVRELQALVGIRSVRGPALDGKPYGQGPDEALRFMLGLCKRLGLRCENVDGRAGHAEIGAAGDGYAAVVCHLDVVPEGVGWSVPPYGGVVRDGMIYGRGVVDNKGAAVVAAFCMRALLDAGAAGARPVRFIFGVDEESGMSDLEHYFNRHPLPKYAFTPDNKYPITNCEKGLMQLDLSQSAGPLISLVQGGNAPNSVPGMCTARLEPHDYKLDELCKATEHYNSGNCGITCEATPDGGLSLTSIGRAAHSMECFNGFNAAANLIRFLCDTYERGRVGDSLWGLYKLIGMATDGGAMGIACTHEYSGPLTLNLGKIFLDKHGGAATIDIRYPADADGAAITAAVSARVSEYGMCARLIQDSPPLFVPPEHPLITKLSEAYTRVSGRPATLMSTGGGSYARSMRGRAVCFGPIMPDSGFEVHCADERISLEALMLHARICVEAMAGLMTVKD